MFKRLLLTLAVGLPFSTFADTVVQTPEVKYVCYACRVDGGGNPLHMCLELMTAPVNGPATYKEVVVYKTTAIEADLAVCLATAQKANASLATPDPSAP